jgi:hypothetical protein
LVESPGADPPGALIAFFFLRHQSGAAQLNVHPSTASET